MKLTKDESYQNRLLRLMGRLIFDFWGFCNSEDFKN